MSVSFELFGVAFLQLFGRILELLNTQMYHLRYVGWTRSWGRFFMRLQWSIRWEFPRWNQRESARFPSKSWFRTSTTCWRKRPTTTNSEPAANSILSRCPSITASATAQARSANTTSKPSRGDSRHNATITTNCESPKASTIRSASASATKSAPASPATWWAASR